jgi:probable phosphoglycerate mutase
VTTLVFVRHGETEWNRNGRWQGHADIPLSAEGRAQARRLAAQLQAAGIIFDRVYASDLGRAFETAEIIAAALARPVHPLLEMREFHLGSWSGLTTVEIRERFPREWQLWEERGDFRRGGSGETMGEFLARVARGLEQLVRGHPGERLLIVTHGGPIRALLYDVMQVLDRSQEVHIGNTSVTEIVYEEGRPRLVRINDLSHLADAGVVDVTQGG